MPKFIELVDVGMMMPTSAARLQIPFSESSIVSERCFWKVREKETEVVPSWKWF